MKQHQYFVSVQHLKDAKGNVSTYAQKLEFYTGNHDDIFQIVEKLESAKFFDEHTTKSFALGLKLFSEVMLEQRNHPLFTEFARHFHDFMKHMKSQIS
ncbi:DUF3861 domain-containing protein [Acinetobacter sp. WU_MDCI_Axc73]|nr:DUF3861 domain-containing protein [Acinetobacter sp. WU_MDCI_Axc73]